MATAQVSPLLIAGRWNTLQILKGARTALLVLTALLLSTIVWGTRVHRDAMLTVGKDAAPSIISAQDIKAALADMDADAANELLAPTNTASEATAGYDERGEEAEKALLKAAGNITYDTERAPIQTLAVSGETYRRLKQEAEDLHDAGSADDVRYYRADALLMDGTLLPAADELDQANNEELERTYRAQSTDSLVSSGLLMFAGMLLLLTLIAVQVFMSRRMRRAINPMLFFATLVAVGVLAYSLIAMFTEQRQLKIAKEDSFTSIHALWRARAIAYEANSEERRMLLDTAHAADYNHDLARETASLASLPAGVSLHQVVDEENRGEHVAGFTGYLADELNNITFAGERDAAVLMLSSFEQYLQVDREIHRLEDSGQHQKAIELCTGTSPGQSNWAFGLFDHALGDTLAINQAHFDEAVQTGLDATGTIRGRFSLGGLLGTLEFKALVAAIVMAVLIVLGFAPRIKEYE